MHAQWDILSILAMRGCADSCANCATAVHCLQPGEILFFHKNFSTWSIQQQNQWLLEYLNSNGSQENMRFKFIVCGKLVCFSLWLAVLGVSQRRFYKARAEFLAGKVTLEKSQSLQKLSNTSNAAIGWMDGELLPKVNWTVSCIFRLVNMIVIDKILRTQITFIYLYIEFITVLVTICLISKPCISPVCLLLKLFTRGCSWILHKPLAKQFYKLWNQHLPNITIPAVRIIIILL